MRESILEEDENDWLEGHREEMLGRLSIIVASNRESGELEYPVSFLCRFEVEMLQLLGKMKANGGLYGR